MNVFVTQQTKHNLESAKKFGKLIVMNLWSEPENMEHRYQRMSKVMRTHDMTMDDYLLLVGDPFIIGLAIYIALKRNRAVKVLMWDKVSYEYKQQTFEL